MNTPKQDVAELIIYTSSNVLTFDVLVPSNNFAEVLANALDEGTGILTQADGNTLLLNGMNYIAIEIKNKNNTPPISA